MCIGSTLRTVYSFILFFVLCFPAISCSKCYCMGFSSVLLMAHSLFRGVLGFLWLFNQKRVGKRHRKELNRSSLQKEYCPVFLLIRKCKNKHNITPASTRASFLANNRLNRYGVVIINSRLYIK